MANSITIKVSELYERAKQMNDDGMDYVEVSFLEDDSTDSDDLEPLPNCLTFSAFSKKSPYASIDYEEVEETSEDERN